MSQKVEVEVGLRDRFSKDYESAAQRIERAVTLLEKQVRKTNDAGAKAATTGKQGADKATDAINKTGNATDALGRKLRQTGNEGSESFGKLQKAAAGFFTLAAAKEFGQKVFAVRSEIQSLQTSFETLVGNKPQAEELLNSIREFAVNTPMQMKGLASAAQTMMSFNIPVEQIMENLKALGDVSMGDEQKFQSLSLAFSQMSATGKLMGQDLLQMINAGFNPLATISEKTGKSIGQLKEEMEKGAISADMVRQAFIDATSEGGKFYGMLEAQSKTLRGAYSNLQGAIDDMFNSIGEQSEGIMAGAIDAATFLVQNYEKVGKAILFVVATYGEYKAAVMVNIALEKAQAFNRLASIKGLTAMQLATTILTEKTKALNAVLMKNPYVLIATAVLSAATAFVIFREKQDSAAQKAKELNEELKNHDDELGRNRVSLQKLQTEWKNLTSDKEKQKWIRDNKDEFHNLGIEVDTVKDAENLLVNNTSLVIKSMELRARAAAHAALATRKYQEALENREEAGSRRKNPSTMDKVKGFFNMGWDFNLSESIAREANHSANKLYSVASKLEDQAEEHLAEQKDLEKQADDLMKEAKVKASSPASSTDKKKKGKTGTKTGRTDEQEAQRRRKLYELELKEIERQAKAERDLVSAMSELDIANEQRTTAREIMQREKDHADKIEQIKRQAEEWKKENYEAEKDKWEASNKDKTKTFADTEAGKAGWQAQSLNDTQLATFNALLAKEYADFERQQQELGRSLVESHQSYTDQKLAIDRTYNDEAARINDAIRQAEQRGDAEMAEALKRSLAEAAKERAKAQGELSLNILKESPEYVRAFEDLQQTSSETLELLISQFEEAKEAAAQSMEPKDLREFTDTLQQMYDELDNRDPFKAMKTSLMEVRSAHREVIKAEKDLKTIQSGGIVTVRTYDKELDKFVDTVVTEEEAMKKVAKAKDKEAKANTKYKKASKDAGEVIENLATSIQNVGGAIGGMMGEIVGLIGDITSVVNGALHAMDNTAQGASASIQAAEKASAILAIISAAIQVIQKISGLVKNLFGANDAKDYEKAKQRYENLSAIWDELIEKKREYLNESWGKEVMGAEEEARALLKIEEEQIRLLAQQRLKVTNGSHSMWYRMWKGSYKFNGQNWQDVAGEISRTLNVTFNSMEDMTNMTSEQLQWIKENYVGLWSVMDGDFREHLEKIISFAKTEKDIIDETMERMTTTGADSVFDDFMDSLYELADGSEDVMQDIADNWQKMVNRMVINNLIGESMKADLKDWYNQLYEVNKQRVTDSLSDEQYKEELDRLSALYNSYVENGKQQIEQLSDMGIIKSVAKVEEEVEEETRGYLDNMRSAFENLVSDSETDMEEWSINLRNSILRNLIQSKLLNDEFDKWANGWSERYSNLMSDFYDGIIDEADYKSRLQALNEEFADATNGIAEQSKKMWEDFGWSKPEDTEDMKDDANKVFSDIHQSFLSTLTDMKDDAEAWSKQITKTMVEQMVEKNILNDAFDGKMDDWRERFENAVTAGDTEGLKALRKELEVLRGSLAEQAHAYMEALGYVEDVVDNVKKETEHAFSNLSDTLVSSVMDLDKSAEEVGRDIGKTLVEQMIKQMVESKYAKRIESIQKMWDGVLNGTSKNTINSVKREILRLYKAIGNETKELTDELREIIEEEMEDVNLFDNLHSSLLSFLTDAGQDIDSFINDLRKNITSQLIDEFVLEGLDEQMALWNAEMKKIMSLGGSPEQIAKDAKELTDQIAAYSESKKKEADMWNQMMGVDNTDYGDQKASVSMADKATYDQFETYLGIATATMIGQEQGNAVRLQILQTLQTMGGITSSSSSEEMRNRMMLANEYLLDIKRSNREILDQFSVKLDSINQKLSRL